MSFTHIIQTDELAQHLSDPGWVIVDCRFDLANPGLGYELYQQGHLPGAVYAHLDNDLAGPRTPATGRHPLPHPGQFVQSLSNWGIDSGKQVVVYDNAGGSFAVRLWWLLRFFGHTAVAVLDGGLPKWVSEGRSLAGGVEHNPPAKFSAEMHPEMLATDEDVERLRLDPEFLLVDARSPERYRGEKEPIDPVAGHIPGAVNRFHGRNLGRHSTLKSPHTLRAEFDDLLHGIDPHNVIVYCGSGVTSIHHLLAMELAGLPGGKLYVGSWSQWIRDPEHPIGLGDQP